MRAMRLIFAMLAVTGALHAPANGQSCPNGRCPLGPLVSPVVAASRPATIYLNPVPPTSRAVEWRTLPWAGQEDVRHLFVDGRQVGAYRFTTDEWRSYDSATNRWSAPQRLIGVHRTQCRWPKWPDESSEIPPITVPK